MRFSFITLVVTVIAGQALAVTPLKMRGDAFSDFTTGGGVVSAAAATSATVGKACSSTIRGVTRTGTCTAQGRCGINIPPNEFEQDASDDCV